MQKKEVLTTFEASRYLNVAPKTVSNWIDAGHLKAYRTVGGHRRIRREDLEVFISAQQAGRRTRAASERRTILVLDAEAGGVEAVQQALRDTVPAVEVQAARSLLEVGLKLAELAPDLLILDLGQGGARNGELLRELRSHPATREIKILGLAPGSHPELAEEGVRQGANRCVIRPVDPAQLRKEVTALLGGS
jgi:excisionase family DNA binding protein